MPTRPTVMMPAQQGVISLLVLLVLVAGVVLVQMQATHIATLGRLNALQYQDNVAALYLAESGMERARGQLSLAAASNPAEFQSTCDRMATGVSYALGHGTFQYLDPQLPSNTHFCALKVVGVVRSAQRVLQTGMGLISNSGHAGFGRNIVSGMENPHADGSVGIFNLAWRRHGSAGHPVSGGSASGINCDPSACVPGWNQESSSGSPSVGSLSAAVFLPPRGRGQVTQSLTADRNYMGLGINLPGLNGQPVIKGSFADEKSTTNIKNNTVTQGETSSGEALNWCKAADTLVFGVSGRGDNDVMAGFTSVAFNTDDSADQAVEMTRTAHAPSTDGTTLNAYGDVFSEIWTTYNPYVYAAQASTSGRTVTVASPISVQAGTLVKVFGGAGKFAAHTRVVSTVTQATQFQVDQIPKERLVNATLCGGICALFHDPSSNISKTQFKLTGNAAADKEWAGGFTCLSGVDPTQINRVNSGGVKLISWREVVTPE